VARHHPVIVWLVNCTGQSVQLPGVFIPALMKRARLYLSNKDC
jgi:hypothetical protein